ncbi:hypothetical protein ACVMHR_001111 [Bradyrhizobium diazoefficiens]
MPRLVCPIGVESVAVPITQTAAVRMPAIITGSASGSSTRTSDCRAVMPTPSAASISAGSMPFSPVMPLRSTGSIEYSASASIAGRKPNAEKEIPNQASVRDAAASNNG